MASEKIANILEEIKSLTILELSDLVKAVEEEFGVSAAAPVGVVAAAGAAPAAASEEKTEFDVILANFGDAPFVVEKGMKVAQIVVARVEQAEIEEVHETDDTDRGTGGFGSTGV